jgi:Flp pilus assembly protein TadG
MLLRTKLRNTKPGSRSPLARFSSAADGATAVEFAMVSAPFFTLIFMLTGFALYFFTNNSIEKGMDTIGRQLRTGQAQKANMTVSGFKDAVCASAGLWINCNKVSVFVDRAASWDVVQQRTCFQPNGAIVTNPAPGNALIADYSGTAQAIVLVTLCYKWDFAKSIPFVGGLSAMDSFTKLQTSTAFRTEPYN